MTRLAYIPNRIIDHNGIADGATVHVYLSGSTTPILLYSDSALTVPLANPFTVAAGAAFPDVFYDSSVIIKLTIVSALDGSIEEHDPYNPLSVSVSSPFISVKAFGAVGDGVTNDSTAFSTAFSNVISTAIGGHGYGSGTAPLIIPKSSSLYTMGTTPLDLTYTMKLVGDGIGDAGGWATALKWGAGSHGYRIQYYNTSGDTATGSGVPGGTGSIIEGQALQGGYAGTEGEFHGIFARSRFAGRDLNIWDWQGDGVHIHAGVGLPESGNASNWELGPAWIQNTRNGVYTDGSDTNQGICSGVKVSSARAWGFYDNSGIGNLYVAPLTQLCGILTGDGTSAASPVSAVSYSGKLYTVKAGQEVAASTNAPSGTTADNAYWYYYGTGAPTTPGSPAWVSGIHLRSGGSYRMVNGGTILHGYQEGDQPPAQLGPATLVLGGTWGGRYPIGGGFIGAAADQVIISTLRMIGDQKGNGGITMDDDVGNSLRIGRYSAGAGTAILGPTAVCANLTITSPNNTPSILVADTQVSLVQPFGYGTGVGGTITQATSRTTGVTLNKVCGSITLFSAAGSATYATMTVTNSQVAATDTVRVCQKSGTDKYMTHVTNVGAGTFDITFATTGGTTTEQPVFNFSVIKGVSA